MVLRALTHAVWAATDPVGDMLLFAAQVYFFSVAADLALRLGPDMREAVKVVGHKLLASKPRRIMEAKTEQKKTKNTKTSASDDP